MERDDQQEAERMPRRVEQSIVLRGMSTIIFIAPNPEVELEDVIRAILQPVSRGEWRVIFIPNNIVADVIRELRHYLELASTQNNMLGMSLNA